MLAIGAATGAGTTIAGAVVRTTLLLTDFTTGAVPT